MTTLLKKLTENVHFVPPGENDRPLLAAISGTEYTLLVDAGNSPVHAKLFLSELSKTDISPIKYVVITHWHWDHIFGLSAMNYVSIAHLKTKEKMIELGNLKWDDKSLDKRVREGKENEFVRDSVKMEYPDPNRTIQVEIPKIAFSRKIEVHLGGITCLIEHVGGDHSLDSSVIFTPEENVVFLGDCIYSNPYRNQEYTVNNLFPLIDKLLSYRAHYYIDSHDEPTSYEVFEGFCKNYKLIGTLVTKYGYNIDGIKNELILRAKKEGKKTDKEWYQNMEYYINAFLAGIKKPEKKRSSY
ncbi:MAG: MBL fold metallo-hydrolase [Candidatus Hodarchaeales archaeon]|jgi:glyoxylase-like metal-dependent hydrolase (beta-lactamase superfamily II)